MVENIKNTKALLLDLDGTVYVGKALIGDVKKTLQYFRQSGILIVYITNNSSKTTGQYVQKLLAMGIYDKRDMFYSSLDATIDYLNANYSDSIVYPLATRRVTRLMKKRGIKIGKNADVVLLTFDTELNYKKLATANKLIVKGATYIATHPDLTCPAQDAFIPDAGSIAALLEASSGKTPSITVGKPFTVMADGIKKLTKIKAENTTVVGDRLKTDILFGINSGFNTALVLSGETSKEQAEKSDIKPDIIIDNIDSLIKYVR